MTKETRNNLIFLVVLLALLLPGGVILFKKKSQPGERPIGSPDPVRQTTAYMDPYPGESTRRLAPLVTLQWVGAVALNGVEGRRVGGTEEAVVTQARPARGGSGNVGSASPFGEIASGSAEAQVMSAGRWFQVVSRGEVPSPWVRVIVWDEDVDPAKGTLSGKLDGKPAEIKATVMAVPKQVRHDLQDAGYVLPPERVVVVDVPGSGSVLEIEWSGDGRSKRDVAGVP